MSTSGLYVSRVKCMRAGSSSSRSRLALDRSMPPCQSQTEDLVDAVEEEFDAIKTVHSSAPPRAPRPSSRLVDLWPLEQRGMAGAAHAKARRGDEGKCTARFVRGISKKDGLLDRCPDLVRALYRRSLSQALTSDVKSRLQRPVKRQNEYNHQCDD